MCVYIYIYIYVYIYICIEVEREREREMKLYGARAALRAVLDAPVPQYGFGEIQALKHVLKQFGFFTDTLLEEIPWCTMNRDFTKETSLLY